MHKLATRARSSLPLECFGRPWTVPSASPWLVLRCEIANSPALPSDCSN